VQKYGIQYTSARNHNALQSTAIRNKSGVYSNAMAVAHLPEGAWSKK